MPIVPRRQTARSQPTLPAPRPAPGVRRDAYSVSSGIEAAGGTAVQAGLDFESARLKEKARADDAAVDSRWNQLVLRKNSILYDQDGALSRRGEAAFSVVEEFGPRFEDAGREIEASLHNDEQREMFFQRFEKERVEYESVLQRHVLQATRDFERQQHETTVETLRHEAALNYQWPGKPAEKISLLKAKIFSQPDKSDKEKGLEFARERSRLHAGVLKRALVDGNDEFAKAYDSTWNKEILEPELAVLERVRRDTGASRKEGYNAFIDDLYRRALKERTEMLPYLDRLFENKEIQRSDYKELRGVVLNAFNDPAIPREEKVDRLFRLIEGVKELKGGIKQTKSGTVQIGKQAGKRDIDELHAFRSLLNESQGYLTPDQYDKFLLITQKAYDDAMAGKLGLLASLAKFLGLGNRAQTDAVAGPVIDKAMSTLDPSISVEKATADIDALKENVRMATNPNRARFPMGLKKKAADGLVYEVVGYSESGNPTWRRVR
jgi:hypothetical protein